MDVVRAYARQAEYLEAKCDQIFAKNRSDARDLWVSPSAPRPVPFARPVALVRARASNNIANVRHSSTLTLHNCREYFDLAPTTAMAIDAMREHLSKLTNDETDLIWITINRPDFKENIEEIHRIAQFAVAWAKKHNENDATLPEEWQK